MYTFCVFTPACIASAQWQSMLYIGISKNTYWGPGRYSLSYCLPCNLVHCSKMKELRIWYPSIYIVIVVRFGCIYLSDQTNNGLLKNQLTFLKFCRGSFQTHIIYAHRRQSGVNSTGARRGFLGKRKLNLSLLPTRLVVTQLNLKGMKYILKFCSFLPPVKAIMIMDGTLENMKT